MFQLPLSNSKSFALIDEIFIWDVSKYTWFSHLKPNGKEYAEASIEGEKIPLSWFILRKLKLSTQNHRGCIDANHINNNSLDNRASNLRYIPHSENTRRRLNNNPNKNITFHKDSRYFPYEVKIRLHHRQHRKSFRTLEEAIQWRDLFFNEHNLLIS